MESLIFQDEHKKVDLGVPGPFTGRIISESSFAKKCCSSISGSPPEKYFAWGERTQSHARHAGVNKGNAATGSFEFTKSDLERKQTTAIVKDLDPSCLAMNNGDKYGINFKREKSVRGFSPNLQSFSKADSNDSVESLEPLEVPSKYSVMDDKRLDLCSAHARLSIAVWEPIQIGGLPSSFPLRPPSPIITMSETESNEDLPQGLSLSGTDSPFMDSLLEQEISFSAIDSPSVNSSFDPSFRIEMNNNDVKDEEVLAQFPEAIMVLLTLLIAASDNIIYLFPFSGNSISHCCFMFQSDLN